jgi:REP element-mobilizing transposase RayT
MRKHPFINDSYYHIYNRGVDKRDIFSDTKDVERFILCMNIFSCKNPVGSIQLALRNVDVGRLQSKDRIVSVVAYCLNPNHFHFILKQEKDNGISEFMKRLEGGYTKYFNIKNSRSGSLFQGKFKSTYAERENYFNQLFGYVIWNYKIHDIPKSKNYLIKSCEDEYKTSNFKIINKKEGENFLEWFGGYDSMFSYGMEIVFMKRKERGKEDFDL